MSRYAITIIITLEPFHQPKTIPYGGCPNSYSQQPFICLFHISLNTHHRNSIFVWCVPHDFLFWDLFVKFHIHGLAQDTVFRVSGFIHLAEYFWGSSEYVSVDPCYCSFLLLHSILLNGYTTFFFFIHQQEEHMNGLQVLSIMNMLLWSSCL